MTDTPMPKIQPLLKGALPLAIANLSIALSPIVDSIMLGRFNQIDQAAAGIGLQVYLLLFILGEGLIFGFSPRYSNFKFNAPNHKRLSAAIFAILAIVIAVALLGAVVALAFEKLTPAFLANDELIQKSSIYVLLLVLALPINLLLIVYWEILTAHDLGRIISAISWTVIFANASLNYVFIFGNAGSPPLGIVGAGIATTLSSLAGLICITICANAKRIYLLGDAEFNPIGVAQEAILIAKAGLPIALSTLVTVGFISTSIFFMERVGINQLSGYLINLQIVELLVLACFGFSECLAIFVAKNRKSLNASGAIFATKQLLTTFFVATTIFLMLIWLSRESIAAMYLGPGSDHRLITQYFSEYLLVTAIFIWADIFLILASGVLRGLGNTLLPLRFNIIGLWVVGLTVMLSVHRTWPGSHIGIVFALQIGFVFAASLMHFCFRRALMHAFHQQAIY